jgi:serine/threonine-protein kinase
MSGCDGRTGLATIDVVKRGDLTGEVLDGRYRVGERVGRGAMGNVYRGERLKLGRVVAIKVMQEGLLNDAFRKRFEREAMAMAKLEHPNCASVLDVGVHEGCPYVVMEFVDGKNLKQLLEAGPLPIQRAVDLTRQVLSGLAHAHEHGVIHRDIKPANIVLSQKSGLGDHVKILDFGLARFHEEASNLTAGVVVGTPNYMAPEQISGAAVDQRTDLYGCGVMLFELLTGAKPFHAADPVAVCMKHLKEAPPRLADLAPGRSFGGLEHVIARALEKAPSQRYATAHDFSQALLDAMTRRSAPHITDPTVSLEPPKVEPSTVVDTPARVQKRRGRGRSIAVVAVGLAALGLGGAFFVTNRSDANPPKAAAPAPAAVTVEAPAPAAPAGDSDAVADLVTRASALAGSGQPEGAIDLLLKARKTFPDDARLPYSLAKLYLEKLWWADGLKQARAAIALDPKLKSDADLIKLVLRGFNTTKNYDWTLARFLREDVGEAAKAYMEDTAKNHPNPIVRSRATAELRRYK